MSKQSKKMAFLTGVSAVLILLLIWAFVPSESPIDYLNRVDNSLGTYVQSRTFGDLKIDLKYKSPTYLATAQMVKSNGIQKYTYDELCEEFKQTNNYVLRLENKLGGALVKSIAGSSGGYQELIQYLSFDIQEDLQLFTSNDTLQCAFVHFERNYDLAPFTNIEIGFNTQNLSQPLEEEAEWVVQFDAERFGLGPLHFRYQATEVSEHPNFTF